MKQWFYGIYGIEFIWHGEYNDPELRWHKKSFNYYDLENALWDAYTEECRFDYSKDPDEKEFPVWVKKNAAFARELLQNFMERGYFYGC